MLTPRERQILWLLANGFERKQIAIKLGISGDTVKNHLVSIYAKLAANNSAHAVHIAHTKGVL